MTRILLLAMVLMISCSFGPRQMEYGWLAYNEAVKASSDQELLLNIVRLRYHDTIEFLSANAISAQLSLSVAVGGSVGRDTGTSTNLGFGEAQWSNRPTFSFTPQLGIDFAKTVITPVPLPILIELVSADWDVSVLFRLLVQNVNGLTNLSGIVSDEFVEFVELMGRMQIRADLKTNKTRRNA